MIIIFTQILPLVIVGGLAFGGIAAATALGGNQKLNGIKSKKVGDGQHGSARWATSKEINNTFKRVAYTPTHWREQKDSTVTLPQGIVLGMEKRGKKTVALVDTGDVHTLVCAAAGAGKTGCVLFPNLEYACASGMSFLTTDTKGDLLKNCGPVAQQYGYKVSIIDLRNPTKSDGFNMLYLVNKYQDEYASTKSLAAKAKAEKYAKITAKTIIFSGGDSSSFGQNSYFYDAAEGLLTATILLVAECCEPAKRHIVSVFKIVQELMAPSKIKGKSEFQILIEKLPSNHKARWFAGAALGTSEQAMASVFSTVLSRLNAFLDSQMEQILCFGTTIDAETFCSEKSAIFLILPEEDPSKFFMISLIIQQLYREMLSVADENGGTLKNRVMLYLDEVGTIPKIQDFEMMFSASRSRKISIVAIVQSLSQLTKNYGKEGADIIIDNCQNAIFGGFAPSSTTAETVSKNLGNQTVMSGSISKNSKDGSQSFQMIGRPLMSVDQLKTMPKFYFIVLKTGCNPMKMMLSLFFKWGITFDKAHVPVEHAERSVVYASSDELKTMFTSVASCDERSSIKSTTETIAKTAQANLTSSFGKHNSKIVG